MATLHKKKNVFEMLSPLWALLVTALHVGGIWYVFFITDNYSLYIDYEQYIKHLIRIAVVVVATWSFAPEDAVSVVRHTLYYIVSAGIMCAAMYYYVFNVFDPDNAKRSMLIMYYFAEISGSDIRQYVVKYTIEYSVYICGAVAAFAAIKYKMSASGWIRRKSKK
ncbi:MAG: hypothetical protein IKO44_03620 [Ruminococcus sp.]|nr:hypothetical protein [Ruminococcus sp.]